MRSSGAAGSAQPGAPGISGLHHGELNAMQTRRYRSFIEPQASRPPPLVGQVGDLGRTGAIARDPLGHLRVGLRDSGRIDVDGKTVVVVGWGTPAAFCRPRVAQAGNRQADMDTRVPAAGAGRCHGVVGRRSRTDGVDRYPAQLRHLVLAQRQHQTTQLGIAPVPAGASTRRMLQHLAQHGSQSVIGRAQQAPVIDAPCRWQSVLCRPPCCRSRFRSMASGRWESADRPGNAHPRARRCRHGLSSAPSPR